MSAADQAARDRQQRIFISSAVGIEPRNYEDCVQGKTTSSWDPSLSRHHKRQTRSSLMAGNSFVLLRGSLSDLSLRLSRSSSNLKNTARPRMLFAALLGMPVQSELLGSAKSREPARKSGPRITRHIDSLLYHIFSFRRYPYPVLALRLSCCNDFIERESGHDFHSGLDGVLAFNCPQFESETACSFLREAWTTTKLLAHCIAYHNLCRMRKILRVTLRKGSWITDHVWTLQERLRHGGGHRHSAEGLN